MDAICVICKKKVEKPDESVKLGWKGAESLNQASIERKCTDITAVTGSVVHQKCRKRHVDKKDIAQKLNLQNQNKPGEEQDSVARSKRQRLTVEERHGMCIFCTNIVDIDGGDGSKVETHNFSKTILECCESRGDEWAFVVKGKINFYQGDLPARDVVYHQSCSSNFRTGKSIPIKHRASQPEAVNRGGRPVNEVQYNAFREACDSVKWGDDEEQVTVSSLVRIMGEKLAGTKYSAYSPRYLKEKVIELFGGDIEVSGESGLEDILTYRPAVASILRDYYSKSREVDVDLQKIRLIEAAAAIIKNDIKQSIQSWGETYPTADSLSRTNSVRYVPPTLRLFIGQMFSGKDTELKIAAVGQSIIQAVRPRAVMAPLQLGLSVLLSQHYRSKFLIETLHALGYCSSYKEALRFERCAAALDGCELENMLNPDSTMKYAADNVDNLTRTLDGKNTFHGMGMIAIISNGRFPEQLIQRRDVTDEEIISKSTVPVITYHSQKKMLKNTLFVELPEFTPTHNKMDVLWMMSWHVKNPIVDWNGCMRLIYSEQIKQHNTAPPPNDTFVNLPIIGMDPSDMTCILSTITFLTNLAHKYKLPSIITFDQPLYWKSMQITTEADSSSPLKEIVLMLGGFHTVMNLLGCIGTLMEGSGLNEILGEIYGDNAVIHMMSGKAYSRAIRGHFIVDYALNNIIINMIDDLEFTEEMRLLFAKATNGEELLSTIEENKVLECVQNAMKELKNTLSNESRTAKLWIGYQQIISLIRKFIRADRLGMWDLHLEAIQEALPIFAAAGHFNYTKSAYLYYQTLNNLEHINPEVLRYFKAGGFVARRSQRDWAGLPCDLTIEQVLMRSLKTSGGLTRGTGFSDVQRSIWLLSKPVCSNFTQRMEGNTGILYVTSEQHKTLGAARMMRDIKDTDIIFKRLNDISPFSGVEQLMNITNGTVADAASNVDEHYTIGESIIKSMNGSPVFEYKFKRSYAAKTMSIKVKIGKNNEVEIDPGLLFQRLLVLSHATTISTTEVFQHELCSYPPSIFESPTLLRKANKPQIVDSIIRLVADTTSAEASLETTAPSPLASPATTSAITSTTTDTTNDTTTPTTTPTTTDTTTDTTTTDTTTPTTTTDTTTTITPTTDTTTDTTTDATTTSTTTTTSKHTYVLDGGSLLYRIKWKRNSTYQEIADSYSGFVTKAYGQALVVFDGYPQGPSTKDNTHLRRSAQQHSKLIKFTPDMTFSSIRKTFLNNTENKSQIIDLIASSLKKANCSVVHSVEDADVDIATHACKMASSRDVTVVGEDTDLLILLLYFSITLPSSSHRLTFRSDIHNTTAHDIFSYRDILGTELSNHLLFLHAFSGCDTTSSFFSIGKQTFFKLYLKNEEFRKLAEIFTSTTSNHDEVREAGLRAILILYGGKMRKH